MVAASERIFEFLEEEEETVTEAKIRNGDWLAERECPLNTSSSAMNRNISGGRGDFSADVKEGQKVALVGPTGAFMRQRW